MAASIGGLCGHEAVESSGPCLHGRFALVVGIFRVFFRILDPRPCPQPSYNWDNRYQAATPVPPPLPLDMSLRLKRWTVGTTEQRRFMVCPKSVTSPLRSRVVFPNVVLATGMAPANLPSSSNLSRGGVSSLCRKCVSLTV